MRALVCLALALVASQPLAAAPGDAGIEFFEKKIRPVLVEHCYACHSSSAPKKRGGFLLDSRDGLRKGGDTGPAIVPGKPGDSLLLKAVHFADESLKMPPKGKLPDPVIADLETWIKMGAPDPRVAAPTSTLAKTWDDVLKARRDWWSLRPVRKHDVPAVKQTAWSSHPVDRFLLARLEEKGLAPAEPADARTVIRRLSLVLTGLPPTVAETEAFVRDQSPDAYEKLVDRLLASPHFGERWARHWLDVVRFSETHGNEWNYEVHHAWRYRDYLIRAFNEDVPYDQLIREHIAGDLLPKPRWSGRGEGRFNESVIGTAFYRFGEVNHDDCIDLRPIGYDLADNQIDTLGKAFQATTIACARCHDHKLDAVSMKDYYALLGIIRGSRAVSHTIDAADVNALPMRHLRDLKAAIRKELGAPWLADASSVGRYLLAAQARQAETGGRRRPRQGPRSSATRPLGRRLAGRQECAGRWTGNVANDRGGKDKRCDQLRHGLDQDRRGVCQGRARTVGVQHQKLRDLRGLQDSASRPAGKWAARACGTDQRGAGTWPFISKATPWSARCCRPAASRTPCPIGSTAPCARRCCRAARSTSASRFPASTAVRCGWSPTIASSITSIIAL